MTLTKGQATNDGVAGPFYLAGRQPHQGLRFFARRELPNFCRYEVLRYMRHDLKELAVCYYGDPSNLAVVILYETKVRYQCAEAFPTRESLREQHQPGNSTIGCDIRVDLLR